MKKIVTQTKQQLKQKIEIFGFALPIVFILSIILLAIGVSTLQLGSAISRSLVDQHWNRLAKVTAQSGVSFAASCIGSGTTSWPSSLTPNKKCDGTTLSPDPGIYINSNITAAASPSRWRTTYTIAPPATGSDGVVRTLVVGKVEVLSSASIVVKTYTWEYTATLGANVDNTIAQIGVNLGEYFTCANNANLLVYCVGQNSSGQLSDGTVINRTVPVQFQLPGGKKAIKYHPDFDHACLLTADQLVYCSGGNAFGQLGDGSSTNRTTAVKFLLPVGKKAVDLGGYTDYMCALTADQFIYCSGHNTSGELGNGTSGTSYSTPILFQLPGGKVAASLATGREVVCAVTADQFIYCSGNNTLGSLGDGTITNRTLPVLFQLPAGKTAASVNVAADFITCAFTTDQLIYCTGNNSFGQLGDGTTLNRSIAVKFQLPAGKQVAEMSTGDGHVCALTTDQLVYCAGRNQVGQLGDGTTINPRTIPVQFILPAGKKAAVVNSVSDNTICVLTADQLVYCAGYNANGQLGDGTTIDRSTPVLFQLPAGKKAEAIAAATYHFCILTTDKLLYCAGQNNFSQLGDGTTIDRSIAVPFPLP